MTSRLHVFAPFFVSYCTTTVRVCRRGSMVVSLMSRLHFKNTKQTHSNTDSISPARDRNFPSLERERNDYVFPPRYTALAYSPPQWRGRALHALYR